jgi:cysteate synthase
VVESDGSIVAIDNDEACRAAEAFQRTEKIDLDPAAAVAFASVLRAARLRRIERDAIVLLNVTGGGHLRRAAETSLRAANPTLSLDFTRAMSSEGIRNIVDLFD